MNYSQAEKYLHSFIDYEKIPGISYASANYSLRHVEELLHRMGAPHLAGITVHIAGTKGKGSVAAIIAQVLSVSGYKTGLYTSPHLHTLRERIKVDGDLISQTEFATTTAEVKPHIAAMSASYDQAKQSHRQLTFFEALTVLAFAYFKKKQVDFQVLEVGLGGRLDATNVAKPEVCIITPISLDHTEVLGDSLTKIAYEKAGIIKPGCWVVLSPQPKEASQVVSDVCRQRGASLVQVGKDVTWHNITSELYHQSFTVEGKMSTYHLTIPLLGDYQIENAATAIAALELLASSGFAITSEDVAQGLARVEWPGRFNILQHRPVVLVDGAHNVASMKRLVSNIKAYFGLGCHSERVSRSPEPCAPCHSEGVKRLKNLAQGKPCSERSESIREESHRSGQAPQPKNLLIIGTSCDKDIPGMVEELVSLSPQVVVTRSSHPRAASPLVIAAEFAKRGIKPKLAENVSQALSKTLSVSKKDDVICVTGSLFLVAEALDYFSRDRGVLLK